MQPEKPIDSEQPTSNLHNSPHTDGAIPPQLQQQTPLNMQQGSFYIDSEKDYELVPWYRKTAPVIILSFTLSLIGAIILLTGDVYAKDPKTGATWQWAKKMRIIFGIAIIVGTLLLISRLFEK